MSKKKIKVYHLTNRVKTSDNQEHVVTVVGKFEQERIPVEYVEDVKVQTGEKTFIDGELTYRRKRLHRKLTIGLAICHPTDSFSDDYGVKLCLNRIKEGRNLGILETTSVTMLTEDAIMSELETKLKYVSEHLEKYIYFSKK